MLAYAARRSSSRARTSGSSDEATSSRTAAISSGNPLASIGQTCSGTPLCLDSRSTSTSSNGFPRISVPRDVAPALAPVIGSEATSIGPISVMKIPEARSWMGDGISACVGAS